MYPVRRQTNPHASRLRKEATDAERRLCSALRNRGVDGFKFRFQASIEPFVVGFLCIEAKLIVEVDGSQQSGSRWLTLALSRRPWLSDPAVLEQRVLQNLEGVVDVIRAALAAETK